MTIFIIARGFPSAKDAQWGSFEKDQAEALASLGHQVVILSIRNRGGMPYCGYRLRCSDNVAGVGFSVLPSRLFGKLGSVPRKNLEGWELWMAYKKAVSLYGKPDVIYSHYMYNTDAALLLKKKTGIPLIAVEHWSVFNQKTLPQRIKSMGKRAYAGSDVLISVSDFLRQKMQEHFGVDSIVVHNMVNDRFLTYPFCEKKIQDQFHYVAVGNLIHSKGFDVLLKALAKMQCRSVMLHIIGTGANKDELQRLTDSLCLSNKVIFHGLQPKEEIIRVMNECHAFVLPSRGETFGVAYIEAMAMGLPVVSTICGGPVLFVNETNGKLVEIDDVDGLAKAMDYVVQNIGHYNSMEIREYVRTRFSGEVIAKQLVSIFNDAIKTCQT